MAVRSSARNGGNESACDYATWPVKHERAAKATLAGQVPDRPRIDASRPESYIASHEQVFSDHCFRPPPPRPQFGTDARSRVNEKFVPPISRHLPPDILPRIRPDASSKRKG
jgi:hypothetical protein